MIKNLVLFGVVTTMVVGYASRSSAVVWDVVATTGLGPTTMPWQVEGYAYGMMGVLQEDSLTMGTSTASAMAKTSADHLQARASASYPSLMPEAGNISAWSRSRFRDTFDLDLPEDFSGNSQLRFSFEFEGQLSGNAGVQVVFLDSVHHVSYFHTSVGIAYDELGVFGSATSGAASFATSFDHVVSLGDQEAPSLTFMYELITNATADLNNPASSSDFAQNSLRLTGVFIEDGFGAAIPGATFTTTSGFNYPVPEPGSLMMGSFAIGSLLVVARRRRCRE